MEEQFKKASSLTEEERGNLEKHKEAAEQIIAMTQSEVALREEVLELQKKHPGTLKPNFEFEAKPEWNELLIKQWELTHEKFLADASFLIKEKEERIERINKDLEN